MNLGIVKGREIGRNRDGNKNRILLQVEMLDEDVRTVELVTQSGEDVNPAIGSRVVVVDVDDGAYRIAIATSDDLAPEVSPGEKEIYSTDVLGLLKMARLKWNANGILDINGDADNAIRYSKYDIDIQSIVTQVNANLTLIATAIGGAYTPVPLVVITLPSKVLTVKLP